MIEKTPRSKFASVLIWLVFGMALLVYQPITLGLTMPVVNINIGDQYKEAFGQFLSSWV